ncbi:MAG: NAD(P)-binding domain-containing protein [Candidatus Hydrogenedentota bacterium]
METSLNPATVPSAEMRTDRHLIIGAGPVGLAFANSLRNAAIAYDHVEADTDLGGNWRHGVYETAHIISSKRTTEYTDYPMPTDYPEFPSAAQMLAYLHEYADHFGLRTAIEFGRTVEWCRPVENNLWEITFCSGERRVYRGVIVANGHHWDPFVPKFNGSFAGQVMHSKAYKRPDQLHGRRVLVIGGGNSACDIAAEAARAAAECHISMRRGHWFMPKTMFGAPTVELMKPWMPLWFQRLLLRACIAVTVGDYRTYGLQKPDHKIFETHPSINSELLHYLRHGKIHPHAGIDRIDGHRVVFTDGTSCDVDLIVAATGYRVSFPFLPEGLVPIHGAAPQVLAGGVLPDYKGLYIVGTLQVRYGFGPLLTPYANLVVGLIRLQETMGLPIGRVLASLGQRPPSTHLVGPFASLRQMTWARRSLGLIAWWERQLRKRSTFVGNRTLDDDRLEQSRNTGSGETTKVVQS